MIAVTFLAGAGEENGAKLHGLIVIRANLPIVAKRVDVPQPKKKK